MSDVNQHRLALTEFLALLHKKQEASSKRWRELYYEKLRADDPQKVAKLHERMESLSTETHTIGGLIGALNSCLRLADTGHMSKLWSPGTEADSLIVLETENQQLRQGFAAIIEEERLAWEHIEPAEQALRALRDKVLRK